MAIPDYQALMGPLLEAVADGSEYSFSALILHPAILHSALRKAVKGNLILMIPAHDLDRSRPWLAPLRIDEQFAGAMSRVVAPASLPT